MKPTFAKLFADAENTPEYWREGCELYSAECKRLNAELDRLRAQLATVREDNKSAWDKVDILEAEIARLQTAVVVKHNAELLAEIERLREEIAKMRESRARQESFVDEEYS